MRPLEGEDGWCVSSKNQGLSQTWRAAGNRPPSELTWSLSDCCDTRKEGLDLGGQHPAAGAAAVGAGGAVGTGTPEIHARDRTGIPIISLQLFQRLSEHLLVGCRLDHRSTTRADDFDHLN